MIPVHALASVSRDGRRRCAVAVSQDRHSAVAARAPGPQGLVPTLALPRRPRRQNPESHSFVERPLSRGVCRTGSSGVAVSHGWGHIFGLLIHCDYVSTRPSPDTHPSSCTTENGGRGPVCGECQTGREMRTRPDRAISPRFGDRSEGQGCDPSRGRREGRAPCHLRGRLYDSTGGRTVWSDAPGLGPTPFRTAPEGAAAGVRAYRVSPLVPRDAREDVL